MTPNRKARTVQSSKDKRLTVPALLTPMLVQYLVGLCCLRCNPDAVDITIGDMVTDSAAEEDRDVDVTVTLKESEDVRRAFKAYEVKKEKHPLDVADVEQLCLKLKDMKGVTHRSIVSTSGFTRGARAKAARHRVDLFELSPWTRPLEEEFPALGMKGSPSDCLRFGRSLLYWEGAKLHLLVPKGAGPFSIEPDDPMYAASGGVHPRFSAFGQFRDALLLRSTIILYPEEPACTVLRTFPLSPLTANGPVSATPLWPHTHTLDVLQDEVFVRVRNGIWRVEATTITGFLQWRRTDEVPLYYMLRKVPGGDPFAGAMIALGSAEGEMFAFVLSPTSAEAGVHPVQLDEKHLRVIRNLKLLNSI